MSSADLDGAKVTDWLLHSETELDQVAVSLLDALPVTVSANGSGALNSDIVGAVMCAITVTEDSELVGRLADLISSHMSANAKYVSSTWSPYSRCQLLETGLLTWLASDTVVHEGSILLPCTP